MTRPTLLGLARPILNGVLGGSPEQPDGAPPEPDCCNVVEADVPDRASEDNGGTAVALAVGGSPSIVQSKEGAWVATSAVTVDFDTTPTPGNTLVAFLFVGDDITSVISSSGWTQLESVEPTGVGEIAIYTKTAGLSEPTTVTVPSTVGGRAAALHLFELVGAVDVSDAAIVTNPGAGDVVAPSLTPTANPGILLMGILGRNQTYVGTATLTPVSPLVQDWAVAKYGRGHKWNGHRGTTTGSYTPTVTVSGDVFEGSYDVGVAVVVITGTPPTWNLPAPLTVDDDDATYETISGPDLLRVDLGAAFRIVRTRIRLATTNAAARVLTIKAANLADFSDEQTITTIAFTAIGSLTAQDVTDTWYTPDSFRYWELSIDSTEVIRVHSWELYEATLGTNHLHDHGTQTGLTDDDHPQYATNAEFDAHAVRHQSGGADAVKLDDLAAPDDNTDLNATTSAHGLLPKLGGGSTNFLRADGTWNAPGGGGGVAGVVFAIGATFDGGGSAITGNPEADVIVPAAGTIVSVTLLADATGDAVIDVWKDTYANYPPTVADTITASAKPTLSSAAKSQDVALTGWTTAVAAGDILRFHWDSGSSITRLLITLLYERT